MAIVNWILFQLLGFLLFIIAFSYSCEFQINTLMLKCASNMKM